jgi:hypothetical protein
MNWAQLQKTCDFQQSLLVTRALVGLEHRVAGEGGGGGGGVDVRREGTRCGIEKFPTAMGTKCCTRVQEIGSHGHGDQFWY